MGKLMKNKMAIIVISVVVCVTVAIAGILIFGKSDKDEILQTLDNFAIAYNDGDIAKMTDYMDSRSKNTLSSANGLGSQLLGIDFGNLFNLSVGILGANSDGVMRIEVKSIEIYGNSADVKTVVRLTFPTMLGERTDEDIMIFKMTKEKGKWLIDFLNIK